MTLYNGSLKKLFTRERTALRKTGSNAKEYYYVTSILTISCSPVGQEGEAMKEFRRTWCSLVSLSVIKRFLTLAG